MRHISNTGLDLIKAYEGFRSHPYGPPADVWTIGYGETQSVNAHTGPWTKAYATKRLETRVRRDYEPYIHRLGISFNQHQFDALVSAIYNLGPGILERGRSLGDALRTKRDGGYNARVGNALREYSMPGSPFHEGLLRRRNEEAALFARSAISKAEAQRRANVVRWQKELATIRLAVRKIGHWTPKRQARAEEIKRAIARTHQTAKK